MYVCVYADDMGTSIRTVTHWNSSLSKMHILTQAHLSVREYRFGASGVIPLDVQRNAQNGRITLLKNDLEETLIISASQLESDLLQMPNKSNTIHLNTK